jgi:adenosylcobyric acid synthase
MNPVLLKPEADHRSQVVVMGRPVARLDAAAYQQAKARIWDDVTAALARLRAEFDVVVIEGAGSPAEINLKARDISNMRIALHASAPVLIVGDIDRGGVFAHLYGTYHLLDADEQALVKGFVINRLRGDPSLLSAGLEEIRALTGVPVVGVVPWIRALRLPEEDSVALEQRREAEASPDTIDVAVVRFPRIANFDDFDPLEAEPGVSLRYVDSPERLGSPDLVVLPGTKATIADLSWLRERGLDAALERARRDGVAVLGICGGYQVLGHQIHDPLGVESDSGWAAGLGWLDVETRFAEGKQTRQSEVVVVGARGLLAGLEGERLRGYEIHAGRTAGPAESAFALSGGEVLGAIDHDGRVVGCYLHGLFHDDRFRAAFLRNVAAMRGKAFEPAPAFDIGAEFDRLAAVLRSSLDLSTIFELIGRPELATVAAHSPAPGYG